jgi:hypothetical protein
MSILARHPDTLSSSWWCFEFVTWGMTRSAGLGIWRSVFVLVPIGGEAKQSFGVVDEQPQHYNLLSVIRRTHEKDHCLEVTFSSSVTATKGERRSCVLTRSQLCTKALRLIPSAVLTQPRADRTAA